MEHSTRQGDRSHHTAKFDSNEYNYTDYNTHKYTNSDSHGKLDSL